MRIHLLVLLVLIAAVVLAGIHFVALELSLYWIYAPLDIPMHFLGGAVIALLLLAASAIGFFVPKRFCTLQNVLLVVLLVGVSWEIFEYVFDIAAIENYVGDTALDLVMDILGGIVGYFVGVKLAEL